MSSLITGSQLTTLTGIFARHFDTFSVFQPIIVNKQPKETKTSTNDNNLPGYGEESNTTNITFTPVSGIFPAIIVAEREQGLNRFPETQFYIPQGVTRIKVQKDARDFIKNGRTESISINDITFNVITDDAFQNYLGLVYYYFSLQQTQ